ncbi:metal ion transporter [Ascosphaera apis ARSEF 7405]|uniref:Metal ion transporter n=1 Tax=Ascosphaera apis ARSEF 7405 TaxID=392613 RepID=A0A162IIV6_9EURO|nr:metal ion transporter [Ascosphaera apis ARSEF 7405]
MGRIAEALKAPGRKPEIRSAAPTQRVHDQAVDSVVGYVVMPKQRLLDRWLDAVVAASGSEVALFITLSALVAWALLGIKWHGEDKWQVVISDIQAIVNYIYDSLLVRQQLNAYMDEMVAAAQVQSRLLSHERMLLTLGEWRQAGHDISDDFHIDVAAMKTPMPKETLFGRFIEFIASIFGHLYTIIIFWIGVLVWLANGPHENWSDHWQLCMNTASACLMVFTFGFLANMRERRSAYSKKCFDSIFVVDSVLELKLRSLTDDDLENDTVVLPAPKMNRIQRGIFYYADFVGTLVGICFLITVMIAWIAVGPAMHFNDNWWLLIGTYAGLIGMNDAFVLRNMQARLNGYVDEQLERIDKMDDLLFEKIGLPLPELESVEDNSLITRISSKVGRACGHELTVIANVVLICGLIAASSAMKWTKAGQLVSNVPPNLIEAFLMIMLITGDNIVDAKKLATLRRVHQRRLALLSFVEGDADVVEEKCGKDHTMTKISEQFDFNKSLDNAV